jgi:hypothetical protein
MDSFPCPPSRFFGPDGKTRYVAKNLVVAIMVFDTDVGRSGLSGRARRLENPSDPTQRISAAIAHNRPHEFSHAFVRLSDEYLGAAAVGLGTDNALTNQSAYATNVVAAPDCDSLPWRHLLHGGPHNPDTEQLVGAFGTAEMGYHSEFRCLMNGTHENASFYGGDGRLRTSDRFCNHCRELTAFRISEHVGILDEPATSLSTWERDHRARFYERFGFVVPDTVPQQSSDGVPHFQACAP